MTGSPCRRLRAHAGEVETTEAVIVQLASLVALDVRVAD